MQEIFQTSEHVVNLSDATLAVLKKEEIKKFVLYKREFIESLHINFSSKQTYIRQLRQFVAWFKNQCSYIYFHELTQQDIVLYKDSLIRLKKSCHTVDGYLVVVRKFFGWLESKKIVSNVARGVKTLKRSKKFQKDCLTQGQIILLLNSIDRSTEMGLRDYALINLLVRTGLRLIEISQAVIGDICQESGEFIFWVQGKGRKVKDESVVLVDEALKPLQDYLLYRDASAHSEFLFAPVRDLKNKYMTTRMISGIIKQRLRNVGLNEKYFSANSLRHTAISLSIKGGASLIQVQTMARHSDPKTTMVYFHNRARIKKGAERYIKI